MLIIIGNKPGEGKEWNVGEDFPSFPIEEIEAIKASGAELTFLIGEFNNIPYMQDT
mgnify:CR=1 FL=1